MTTDEAASMARSYILQDLYWNEDLQRKADVIGGLLSRQPFPIPELYTIGRLFNRSLLLHIVVLKLEKDLEADDTLFRAHLPQYIEFYQQTRHGESKTSAQLPAEMLVAIDRIGRYLENLPPDDRPPFLWFRGVYNRRLILTLALAYAADVVEQLS